jgi:hypothetical protein
MWLPTRAQVDSVSRHGITIAGTAITIFGLQARGFNLDQIKALINALGAVTNDLVVLAAAVAPVYAALKAAHTASSTSQIAAVQTLANSGGPDTKAAQIAVLNAAASIPSTAKVVNPALAPEAATNAKVTTT